MTTSPTGRLNLTIFSVCLFGYAVTVFFLLRSLGMNGRVYGAVCVTLFASSIPMFIIGRVIEGTSLSQTYDLSKGSYAYILGDSLALPLVVGASAHVWKSIDPDSNWRSGLWTAISLAVGLGFSAWFHFYNEFNVYPPEIFRSPTKIYHDFVAYPVLLSGVVMLFVPALKECFSNGARLGTALAVVGIFAWVLFGVKDGLAKLPPANLHPAWDWTTLCVIPPTGADTSPS